MRPVLLDSSPDVESRSYSEQRRQRHRRHHHGQHGYQYLSIIDRRSPSSRHLLKLTYLLTGVGDGGRGTRAPKFDKKISGNYHLKFGHFSGKYHVKFGHFVNFSNIIFEQKCLAPKVDRAPTPIYLLACLLTSLFQFPV